MDCQPPPQTTNSPINNNNSRHPQLQWIPKNGRQSSVFVYRNQTAVVGRKCANNTSKSNDKRSRTSFSKQQLKLLEEAFKQTNYPNQVYRDQLAADIELEPARVQIWFQNRRAKLKKQLAGKQEVHHVRHHIRVSNLTEQQRESSNLINQQQQQLYLASSNETALDLHLSSHNNSSLSSRSSSSDDLNRELSMPYVCPTGFISPITKVQTTSAGLGPNNQQQLSDSAGEGDNELSEQGLGVYYTSAEVYGGALVGEQQLQVYQQQPTKVLHQFYLPSAQPPPPPQPQLFSLQAHQQEQQQEGVSEFSRILNSELGKVLYSAASNQQRQQPNRQVFYQQQARNAQHLGLEQPQNDQYSKY